MRGTATAIVPEWNEMIRLSLKQTLPYILILGSVVGLFASSVLIYDQVKIWQNPNFAAPCSLNPVISCGSVINSGEGHVFGAPSPFLGLVMFSALATFGVLLAAGTKFNRYVWVCLQIAVTGGVIFALWLFWLSLYRIKALCPYCLATDAAVYIMAWYVTLYNLEHARSKRFQGARAFCRKHHLDIIVGILLTIAAFTLHHFWYYYGRYFT